MSLWVNRRRWLWFYESWSRAPRLQVVICFLPSKQSEWCIVVFLSLSGTCHKQFTPHCLKRRKLLPQEPTKPSVGQWSCYLATECSKARVWMLTLPSIRVVFSTDLLCPKTRLLPLLQQDLCRAMICLPQSRWRPEQPCVPAPGLDSIQRSDRRVERWVWMVLGWGGGVRRTVQV